jgi:uncharacterized protein YaaW (UPF0174 family)
MKYRPDPDLDFLRACKSEDLNMLVYVLTTNKDGQQRSIVQLPNHPLYKQHAPNHASYWEAIAGEIQRYGSNPLAALARAGRGKHYIKILENVCNRFSINYIPDAAVEVIEKELCMALFSRSLPHIPTKDFPILCQALQIKPKALSPEAISQTLNEAMRLDDHLESHMIMIVAHAAAIHASSIGYTSLAQPRYHPVLEIFEKPIATELDTISPLSFTGAAHWIIVPTIIQLAYVRAQKNLEED